MRRVRAERILRLLPAITLVSLIPKTYADPIAWSSATATFDQNYQMGIGGGIDGDINSQGWAVFGGQYDPQTAIFTAAAPLDTSSLNFGLYFTSGFAGHNLNEFRISATNDPTPSDSSPWTPLPLTALSAQFAGTTLNNLADNHVRSAGATSGTDAY